jgi:hypothetical protein
MPKIIKIFLFVFFPLFLIIGGAYGLAKIGVIPVRNLAKKNPALRKVLHVVGLDSPKLPTRQVARASASVPAPDPLEGQRKALAEQRAALEKERADWETERQSQQKAVAVKAAVPDASSDPKSLARLASVYEQMPPESVTRIFAKLPDPQVIALLRRMDEKQVAQILAIVPPDRAARMTLALAKPAAPPPVLTN